MKKRGQISFFFIIAIAIIATAGLFFYANSSLSKPGVENQGIREVNAIKSYVEACLKKPLEQSLYKRIGPQAGFIDPKGDAKYKEPGISSSISPSTSQFDDAIVPIYLEASSCNEFCKEYRQVRPAGWKCLGCVPPVEVRENENCPSTCRNNSRDYIPEERQCILYKCHWSYKIFPSNPDEFASMMSKKISNYIEAEFLPCFDSNKFGELKIEIIKEKDPVYEVELNAEDVTVKAIFPLTIKKGSSEAKLENFEVTVPIRLKALYESSIQMVQKISSITETDVIDQVRYNIEPDCPGYDKNGYTNVYIKKSNDGTNIVRFADFSSYYIKYIKTFVFQFGIKNVKITMDNPDKIGRCVGY